MANKPARLSGFIGSGALKYRVNSTDRATGVVNAEISVDFSKAVEPPHFYVADYFHVADRDPQIVFTFGKVDSPADDSLRSRLEIYMPATQFNNFWKTLVPVRSALERFQEKYNYARCEQGELRLSGGKSQTLLSHIALTVANPTEASMDFYYLSQKSLAINAPRGEPINLEPQVRVIMSPGILLGVCRACEPIALKFVDKYAPEVANEPQ
ncbi:MAG TPA: hypothetical protein VIH72_05430 [Candidatus Acidoferrales bacterium]